MKQDWLEHMMMLFVEQELANDIDLDLVIDKFKNIVPFVRRMALLSTLVLELNFNKNFNTFMNYL